MSAPNVSSRLPTEKQYAYLRALGGGSAIIVGKKRETEMYLRRGWVTAEHHDDEKEYPYAWIRITPEGLRALAAAVEKYGLFDLGPKPVTERRVCARCGSSRYRLELVELEREAAVAA